MRKLDLILGEIFDSKDYRYKGASAQNVESFIIQVQDACYLVLVMKKTALSGGDPSYEYALYSLSQNAYICKDTELFKQVTCGFPSLARLDRAGGVADFMETLRLMDVFDELVEKVSVDGKFTEQTAAQYRSYLADMEKMKAASVQALYRYFGEIALR